MGGRAVRSIRGRPARRAAVGGAAVLTLAGALVACGSSEGGDGLGASSVPTGPAGTSGTSVPSVPSELPAESVVDRCGNDLSGLESTAWGVDPADGSVRWSTTVPLADDYLLRSSDGNPQLPLVQRAVELELDGSTGEPVAYPPAGAHEVLIDPASGASGTAALLVDGERQPPTITVDGLTVTTAAGATGQSTVGLTGTDPATPSSASRWRVELGPADQVATLSPPVLYGDTVVVVTSPPRPSCP